MCRYLKRSFLYTETKKNDRFDEKFGIDILVIYVRSYVFPVHNSVIFGNILLTDPRTGLFLTRLLFQTYQGCILRSIIKHLKDCTQWCTSNLSTHYLWVQMFGKFKRSVAKQGFRRFYENFYFKTMIEYYFSASSLCV